jgi:hypothetical protein
MERSMRIFATLLIGVCISGCGTIQSTYETPTVMSANPASITLQYRNGRFNAAQARATDHCAVIGRTAQMERVLPAKTNFSSGVFNCV